MSVKDTKKLFKFDSDKLQKIFNKLGDSPLDEPELYDVFKDTDLGIITPIFKHLVKGNMTDFKDDEIIQFVKAVSKKVLNLRDKFDKLKETDLVKDIEPLSLLQKEEFITVLKQFESRETDDKLIDDAKDLVLSYSGIDGEKISEWELELLIQNYSDEVTDHFKSLSGNG